MAEIGLTETVGDSGVKFEIWFRQRRKSQDSYILQASSPEVKAMWTDVIGKILWRQVLRNRGGRGGSRGCGEPEGGRRGAGGLRQHHLPGRAWTHPISTQHLFLLKTNINNTLHCSTS